MHNWIHALMYYYTLSVHNPTQAAAESATRHTRRVCSCLFHCTEHCYGCPVCATAPLPRSGWDSVLLVSLDLRISCNLARKLHVLLPLLCRAYIKLLSLMMSSNIMSYLIILRIYIWLWVLNDASIFFCLFESTRGENCEIGCSSTMWNIGVLLYMFDNISASKGGYFGWAWNEYNRFRIIGRSFVNGFVAIYCMSFDPLVTKFYEFLSFILMSWTKLQDV